MSFLDSHKDLHIEASVNQALLGADAANQSYLDNVRTKWGPQLIGAMGEIGVDAAGAVTFGLSDPSKSQAVLNANLDTVLGTFGARSPEFASAAQLLGLSVSDALKLQLDNVPVNTTAQLSAAVGLIQSYVPTASLNASAVASAIASTYVGGIQSLTPATATALAGAANAVLTAQPGLAAASASTALIMAQQFGNQITGGEGIPAKGSNAYKQLVGDIRGQIPNLSTAAADAAIAQAAAFEQHKGDISGLTAAEVAKIPPRIRAAEPELQGAGHSAGTSVTTGVTSGIVAGSPAAQAAATTAGTQTATRSRRARRVPSRVGRRPCRRRWVPSSPPRGRSRARRRRPPVSTSGTRSTPVSPPASRRTPASSRRQRRTS
jgi:hypothetical protein